jgi:branched-chain amino acid transport system permease protein
LFEQVIIATLSLGGLYALLSMGFALILGVARIMNFAHGALYMVAAYLIIQFAPLGLGVSYLISLVAIAVISLILYRLFIGPMREKESEAALVTVALALIFQELVKFTWGPEFKSVPSLVSGYATLLGVRITNQKLLALLAASVIFLFLWIFINWTKLGKGVRAVAQNMEVARLVGVNVRQVFMITMGISAVLAGLAAVFFAPLNVVSPIEWTILFQAFPVIVLGGLGSLKGAFVASFIMAFIEKMVEFYIAGGYAMELVSFAIMVIILLVRPTGLFGKKISAGVTGL